jgi:ferrous iron transport protein A
MVPLGMLGEGEKAEITGMHKKSCKSDGSDKKSSFSQQLEAIGLRVGQIVEVLNNGGTGPMLLRVGETRLALGRGMSMKIFVKP